MDKFLMICYVAADFSNGKGDIFRVLPNQIGTFVETPAWVKETLLFKWLLADGSVKVALQGISMKQGENDPMKGMAADGKKEEISEAAEEEIVSAVGGDKEEQPEPIIKTRSTRSKKAKKDDAK